MFCALLRSHPEKSKSTRKRERPERREKGPENAAPSEASNSATPPCAPPHSRRHRPRPPSPSRAWWPPVPPLAGLNRSSCTAPRSRARRRSSRTSSSTGTSWTGPPASSHASRGQSTRDSYCRTSSGIDRQLERQSGWKICLNMFEHTAYYADRDQSNPVKQ